MKHYKINLDAVIPVIMLSILVGFTLGAKAERDIQRVVALTPTSSVEVMATNIPIVTPNPLISPKVLPPLEPISTAEPVKVWETFEATAYCSCVKCCGKSDGITASGKKAREEITIAADWKVLPKGTEVEVEGLGSRIVQDRGGAIRGNRIDIYFSSHKEALEFGRQQVKVRVVESEGDL